MRPPEELPSVDWPALTHAYGGADDVPGLIRALYTEDGVEDALYELYGNVHHQGTVYPATVEAVPFLAHAALHAATKRDEVLMLLVAMADQPPADPVTEAVLAAIGAAAQELLPCLDDPDPAVRRAAVQVAAMTTDPKAVTGRLSALYAADPDDGVRAGALTALARLDPDEARVAAALRDDVPAVRLAAALLALERSSPPYPAEPVEIIAAAGAELDGEEERLTTVLTADVDAGLAVAARWVAGAARDDRGFWLAEYLAETWRDHEEQVVAVLAATLPHQPDSNALRLRLEAVARWIGGVREVDGGLREALRGYATAEDARVAEAARLALVRCGDPEVRSGRFTLSAQALAEAGGTVPQLRTALADADDRGAIRLVSALDPETAGRLLPELTDLLRAGRAAVPVARLLGGFPDAEVMVAMEMAMTSENAMLRATAAASHAQLTGDGDPVLRVLEPLLTAGRQVAWYLPEAARLGAAGAPLVPVIEELLRSLDPWPRMAAAEAHWRITGDPGRAVPVLAGLAEASPVGLRALEVLAAIGTTPAKLRPRLRHFAWSPARLMEVGWPPEHPHPDERLRATALRLLG